MKIKKYLISAMAIFLMGSMVACQSKPADNKKDWIDHKIQLNDLP